MRDPKTAKIRNEKGIYPVDFAKDKLIKDLFLKI